MDESFTSATARGRPPDPVRPALPLIREIDRRCPAMPMHG
jgi:hypothetical protein